ncbi:Sensory transduction protein LytR [Flagellimonas maritima]|uniref:Sensory transduction protein LytR n=1 Tax=Flagellimonas maritima TaxID=1383885 RepID=A0A2Z4LRT2_9FLAO|nr:LytTR family DNA-binding domain-containing protein [Allomuricauda aurantiaca]AWX44410.1 Sensory transduction protein LytR [Allomuricauda aurantiaca]
MYKCIIVDDEELARNLIKNHLKQLNDFEIVAICESAIDAINVLLEHKVDLLFLDIEMPVLKGTDFFKNLVQKPHVIFTTAYRDFALDGFELNAIDYLLKPITFSRFLKSIEKFKVTVGRKSNSEEDEKVKYKETKKDHIFISVERKKIKLNFDEIIYVKSVKDYVHIHLHDTKYLVKYSLCSFLENLDERFYQIHRSYVVNTSKITAYTKNYIEIDDKEISIGESYRATLLEYLSNH